MTREDLALLLRLHAREGVLAADLRWRRAVCWAVGHDYHTRPFRQAVCIRCDANALDGVAGWHFDSEHEA